MITSIINQKGGTGKTTTTVNLGSALAAKGKSVLLIDLDPQGNLSYSLGINDFTHSVDEVMLNEVSLKAALVQREGMDVIPTGRALSKIEFMGHQEKTSPEFLLRNTLQQAERYDHILIDCPPSLSLLTINALSASQSALIPIQLDVFSIQGLEQILDTITEITDEYNASLQVLGVLPVLVDSRRKLTSEVKEYVREHFDVYLFESWVRANVKAAEAPSFGESVMSYEPKANSAKDYRAFSEEFLIRTTKLKNN